MLLLQDPKATKVFVAAILGGSTLLYSLWRIILPNKPNVLSAGQLMYKGVKNLYDKSSSIWISTWGEHMHSGFYRKDEDVSKFTKQDHLDRQEEMMRQLLLVLAPDDESLSSIASRFNRKTLRILDCGCGVGGSSRYLYQLLSQFGKDKFKAVQVVGITLSPYQQKTATKLTGQLGLPILSETEIFESDKSGVCFLVRNALKTEFKPNSFDLVWSLESGEHMPTKNVWLTEIKRILCEKGWFLCACWCHRETKVSSNAFKVKSKELSREEKVILGRISQNYSLPKFVPPSEYKINAEILGMIGFDESITSFTTNVMPFWPAVVRSCLKPVTLIKFIFLMPFGGFTVLKGAVTAYLMNQGFVTGTLEFPAFAVQKL